MATTASRFLKFIALHGLPFGFMIAASLFGVYYLFHYWKENEHGMAETLELIPAFLMAAVVTGIGRGVVLWLFRREENAY